MIHNHPNFSFILYYLAMPLTFSRLISCLQHAMKKQREVGEKRQTLPIREVFICEKAKRSVRMKVGTLAFFQRN